MEKIGRLLSRTCFVALAAFAIQAKPVVAGQAALLIGSSEGGLSGGPDADRFAKALIADAAFSKDNITLLTEARATRSNVLWALADLQRSTKPGDRVIIYYSGLGGQQPTEDPKELDGLDEVLILNLPDGELITDDEIERAVNGLTGRHVSVYLDTAFRAYEDEPPPGLLYRGAGVVNMRGMTRASIDIGNAIPDVGNLSPIGSIPDVGTALSLTDPVGAIGEGLEVSPIFTENPLAEINVAASSDSGAWETENGGVFSEAVIAGAIKGGADKNENGKVSATELAIYNNSSFAELCESVDFCESTSVVFSPVRIVADNRIAALNGLNVGVQSDTGDAFGWNGLVGPSEATSIDAMSYEERLTFVTERFGDINRASLQMQVAPGPNLKVGDIVKFDVSAQRDGNFILIDIDPLGRVVQVYPSPVSPKEGTLVRAGAIVSVPSALSRNQMPLRIRVVPPIGRGMLMAIFVEGDLKEIDAVLPEDIAGAPVADGFGFLYELADGLLGLYTRVGPTSQIWSTAILEYEITN